MRTVYRMPGLLRDATEEFIERFDDKHQRQHTSGASPVVLLIYASFGTSN
jgi:hypothetical protein